jgi:hypothetical protein
MSPGVWKAEDLPLTLVGHLVAGHEALNDQAAVGGTVTLSHEVLIGPDLLHADRQGAQGVDFTWGEIGDALQLGDKRLGRRLRKPSHWRNLASMLIHAPV